MITTIVLIISLLLLLLILTVITGAIVKGQTIIGRPPIPVFYFVLGKVLVAVNLTFLLLKGLRVDTGGICALAPLVEIIALVLLIAGTVILFFSTVKLKNDLIFGLSSSEQHKLQTTGIYSFSRHPFYLGFILILFSSCLFNPNIINFAAFLGAWSIHHKIMIKEEEFLTSQYGEEYIRYAKKVKRYITISK